MLSDTTIGEQDAILRGKVTKLIELYYSAKDDVTAAMELKKVMGMPIHLLFLSRSLL